MATGDIVEEVDLSDIFAEAGIVSEEEVHFDDGAEKGNTNDAGNTKVAEPPAASSKKPVYRVDAQTLLLTVNPSKLIYYDKLMEYLIGRKPNYIISAWHNGPSNRHIHIYAQYPEKKTFSANKLFHVNMKKTTKSAQYSRKYVLAIDAKHERLGVTADKIFEQGIMNLNGGFYKIKSTEIADFNADEMGELGPREFLIANRVQEVMRKQDSEKRFREMLAERRQGIYKKPEVIVYNGESDAGKTSAAYNQAFKKYADEDIARVNFDENGFAHIDGDSGNMKCLIFEEFRDADMSLRQWLQLCDGTGYRINVKGSDCFVRPERICFSSTLPLNKWYAKACSRDKENQWQILRRVSMLCTCYIDEHGNRRVGIEPKKSWQRRPIQN